MTANFIAFGEPFSDLDADHLNQLPARKTLTACHTSKDFEIMELRRLDRGDGKISDIIIVDCVNEEVPTRNQVGIKVRERLALVFTSGLAPEARALRRNFPPVPHRNHVPPNEPHWLCLYFEPWEAVERTWSPQNFLQRVLWWLTETANGTLHRDDQQVEQLYFDSPFTIVLPPDFNTKVTDQGLTLVVHSVLRPEGDFRAIRGDFFPKEKVFAHNVSQTEVLTLELPPVVHGIIEYPPNTLGEIHDQLEQRGAPLLDGLNTLIMEKARGEGITPANSNHCLLIITCPVKRIVDGEPERFEVRAFLLHHDLGFLGRATGALEEFNGRLYAIPAIGEENKISAPSKWREIAILPVEVTFDVDKNFARKASGVDPDSADFKGVLAGVGALGSAMAELWAKNGWGEWTFVDADIVKAHNTVRHIAKNEDIGHFKVDIVKKIVEANYSHGYYSAEAIPDSITNPQNDRLTEQISAASLVVDCTTTLEVPRTLAYNDAAPRSVSAFLSPSGQSSVLFIETSDRSIRLDSLEAQYYRAIINSDWGSNHLIGHKGALWVGAGCRDVSAIISDEVILLHAATLASQIRLLRDKPEARIRVWSSDIETGALEVREVPVYESERHVCGDWQVILDAAILAKLSQIRYSSLPSETGGVVVGYIDQKIKAIFVVDVLPAPPDSEADPTGFTRGIEGLNSTLHEVAQRSANIVKYIGEWHSHPAFTSARPSTYDRTLIQKLAETLALDGQPALMVITGSAGDLSITVKDNG